VTPVRVITFNAAGGNPACTATPAEILAVPFMVDVVHGAVDAPIVGLQEVTPALRRALLALRPPAGRPFFEQLHVARPGQGNALLIPGRFEVIQHDRGYLMGAMRRVLVEKMRQHGAIDGRQALEVRMWLSAQLRDTITGRWLSVFCTHLSGCAPVRLQQARDVFDRVHATADPVTIVLADLNIRRGSRHPQDDAITGLLFPPLRDVAPVLGSLDWVLGTGVNPMLARALTDIKVSDHYPLEAIVEFRGVSSDPVG
jgi:endonuclease/exonuclease/phosphatase family metal-dependent hydrolase